MTTAPTLPGFDTEQPTDTDRLRAALAEAVAHADAGRPVPGNRLRSWRNLLTGVYSRLMDTPEAPATPLEEGLAASALAAAKWTPDEVAAVDQAIRTVADAQRELTAADVWRQLGPDFLVTKGLAARLMAAANAGVITHGGRQVRVPADAPGPNHGQRLTVWRSLRFDTTGAE